MKAITLLLMSVLLLASVEGGISKFYDPVTGMETNNGVEIKFNPTQSNNKISRSGVTKALPTSLPIGNEGELRNHMARMITDTGFSIYQNGTNGDIYIYEIVDTDLNFSDYAEFLVYARNQIEVLANKAIATLTTNSVYNPARPIKVGFAGIYSENFGEFRYWNNLFKFAEFPMITVDGVKKISPAFVNSWEPQITAFPVFEVGNIDRVLFFQEPNLDRPYHNTSINTDQSMPMWVDYDGEVLHISRDYILGQKVWYASVILKNQTSFVLRKSGAVEVSTSQILITGIDDGGVLVRVTNSTPGTIVVIETSEDLSTWGNFANLSIGRDGTGSAVKPSENEDLVRQFFRVK